MYGKLMITATIEVVTGLHIGTSNAYAAIGALNSPVVRDAMTQKPILPGSSLKGKLRTLLARSKHNGFSKEQKEDHDEVKRLFGTAADDRKTVRSRLQFYDCFVSNSKTMEEEEVGFTEVKIENTINRLTAVAKPRQIERVVRGTEFEFVLGYDAEVEAEIKPDIQNLAEALILLQMDYLGGHGTRGYGRVRFRNFQVKAVRQCISKELAEELRSLLEEVEKDATLSV